MSSSFDTTWETNVYSQGRQINRYPFTDLVAAVMRTYGGRLKAGERLRALELGCGTGNNCAFLAEAGFETHGIDGSDSACRIARAFLDERGVAAAIVRGDLTALDYADASFDLVVDRAAVYCNKRDDIRTIVSEVRRCLRPGGRFISFVFADDHGDRQIVDATQIEPGTYKDFKSGSFAGTGVVHLFSEAEIIQDYMAGFEIEFLHHSRKDSLLPERKNIYTEYQVCGRLL